MATKDNLISPDVLGFDPDALAKRYAVERDKRIRADAEEQFVQLSHDSPFTNKYLQEDPYCKPLDRAPLKDQREVIVIGGGWVGMLTAARLAEAGITDVRIVESGSDFGGTWYWNRYPGAQCDIESYSYLPLLEETGYVPKLRFSYASEIYEHAQRIGRHFDLYKDAVFQTWVTELRWLEDESVWLLATDRGDQMRARRQGPKSARYQSLHNDQSDRHASRQCFEQRASGSASAGRRQDSTARTSSGSSWSRYLR